MSHSHIHKKYSCSFFTKINSQEWNINIDTESIWTRIWNKKVWGWSKTRQKIFKWYITKKIAWMADSFLKLKKKWKLLFLISVIMVVIIYNYKAQRHIIATIVQKHSSERWNQEPESTLVQRDVESHTLWWVIISLFISLFSSGWCYKMFIAQKLVSYIRRWTVEDWDFISEGSVWTIKPGFFSENTT